MHLSSLNIAFLFLALAMYVQPLVAHAEKKAATPAVETNPRLLIQKYTKDIKANPNDFAAYFRRGKVYMKMNDISNAIADMKSSLKANPYRDTMRIGMVKMDPDLNAGRVAAVWTHQWLGYLYCSKHDYINGVAELDKAIAMRPAYAKNYSNRSMAYRALGRDVDAKADEVKFHDLQKHPLHDDCVTTNSDPEGLKELLDVF